ncbi:MAG: hypothetical protein K2I64_01865 [Muribaculaceae bacterium]|nr:hypothetical protein [Muribaculaceae bacterium]
MAMTAAETAKSIISKALAVLNDVSGIEAQYGIASAEGSSKGDIILSGNQFFINGGGIVIWYDGKTQWSYTEHTGEVNITEPTEEELAEINPLAILNSDPDIYSLKLKKHNKSRYDVELKDKSGDLSIAKAVVTISADDWIPTGAVVETSSGEKYALLLKNVKKLKNISPDTFRFNPKTYPDVDVIDLR